MALILQTTRAEFASPSKEKYHTGESTIRPVFGRTP